jgi:UDP-N-acetylmuramoyl-tripeptide--D-alanyl-D-alanine ligase
VINWLSRTLSPVMAAIGLGEGQVRRECLYWAAYLWRRLLIRTTLIAITGSVGKTTTKELVADILSKQAPTARSYGSQNNDWGGPPSISRIRPWHRFAVIEIGTHEPGIVRRLARMAKPDIAVVLAALHVHRRGFRTHEAVVAEKASLLRSLRRGGVAVLNADDPSVARMEAPRGVTVRRFGRILGSDCRVLETSAVFPGRLHMRVAMNGLELGIQTKLVGESWAPSVLAALLVTETAGITPADAIDSISRTEPYAGRLQPAVLPSGAVMIRDDHSGQFPTWPPALRVLEQAQATRRILVASDCSDTSRSHQDRMKYLGRQAARCSDLAVFLDARGDVACAAAVRDGMDKTLVHHIIDLQAAAEFLRRELRAGDVVLVKGRAGHHLALLYFALLGSVRCWTPCSQGRLCDACSKLGAGLEEVGGTGHLEKEGYLQVLRARPDGSTESAGWHPEHWEGAKRF